MSIPEVCRVWIDQRIDEERDGEKSHREIGRIVAKEVSKYFEVKISPETIRKQVDRGTNVPSVGITKGLKTLNKVKAIQQSSDISQRQAIKQVARETGDEEKTVEQRVTREKKKQMDATILACARVTRAEVAKKRRVERIEKIADINRGNTTLDVGKKYAVIYADPPWKYDFSNTISNEIENHYPTMTVEEMGVMGAREIAADNCVLYMWATAPKLLEAIKLIDLWGFEYKTHAIWDKQKIGMGYWFRGQHELLLVATKGSVPAPASDARFSSVFSYPRGKHSEKPVEFYEVIEKAFYGLPMVELFARNKRKGWDSWGNQS